MTGKIKYYFIPILFLVCSFLFTVVSYCQDDQEQKEKLMKKRLIDESIEKVRFYYANKYYDKTIDECNNLEKLDPNNGIAVYYRNLAELRLQKFEEERKRAIQLGQKPPELPKPQDIPPEMTKSSEAPVEGQIKTGQEDSMFAPAATPTPIQEAGIQTQQPQEAAPPPIQPPSSSELSPYEPPSKPNLLSTTKGKIIIIVIAGFAVLLILWTIINSGRKRRALLEQYKTIQTKKIKDAVKTKAQETPVVKPPEAKIEAEIKEPLKEKPTSIDSLSSLSSLSMGTGLFDKPIQEQKKKEEIEIPIPKLEPAPLKEAKSETMGEKELGSLNFDKLTDDSFGKEISQKEGVAELPIAEEKIPEKKAPEGKSDKVPVLSMLEFPDFSSPLDVADKKESPSHIESKEIKKPEIQSIEIPESIDIGISSDFQFPSIDSSKPKETPKKSESEDKSIKPIDFPEVSIPNLVEKDESVISPFEDNVDLSETIKPPEPLNGSVALDEFLFESSSASADSVGKKDAQNSSAFTSKGLDSIDVSDNFATANTNIENEETLGGITSDSEKTEFLGRKTPEIKEKTGISSDDEDTKLIPTLKSKQPPEIKKSEPKPIEEIKDDKAKFLDDIKDKTAVIDEKSVVSQSVKSDIQSKSKDILENVPGLNFDLETESTIGLSIKSKEEESLEKMKNFKEESDLEDKEIEEEIKEFKEEQKAQEKRIPLPTNKTKDRNELLFNEQFKKGMFFFNKKDWKRAVHYLTIAAAIKPNDPDLKEKLNTARENRKKSS